MAVRLTIASTQALTRATPFDYNAAYTVLGLVYFPTLPGSGSYTIWANYFDASNEERFMYFFTTNSFKFRTRDTAADTDINSAVTPVVGTWYYVAVVRSTAADTELFVGTSPESMASQGTANHTLNAARTGNAAVTFAFGRNFGAGAFADERIRSWRVWTSALTLNEIRTELSSLDVAVKASPWAAWPLAVAGTLTDTSGNARTLTAEGTPTTEADPGALAAWGGAAMVGASMVRPMALRQDWVEAGNTRVGPP